MILAMDGWIFKFLKTKHRCWLIRGCSILIASLLCISCGKKITDNNKDKVKANKTNIQPIESEIQFTLKQSGESLTASYFIADRFFFEIPEKIISSNPINDLSIYFHVIGSYFEFVCDYISKNNQLLFKECIDDEGYIIKDLVPGQQIHLPAEEEILLDSKSTQFSNTNVVFNIINK